MTRKTSFVSLFLVFAVLSGSAYAEENYATETYVDDQFAEVVGHVNKQDRTIRNEMKTNNDQLFANLVLLRDMLNTRDADRNWITLDTEAQLAIPAINELKAALDAKANADEVLTADSLTELNEAVAALESGKATVADLEALQATVDALGDTYATDDEVSTAIANVQSAIDNIDLSAYAKTADLAPVAISGSYADLTNKPDIPSIEGLATDQDLTDLRSALETEIANKQIAGDYADASDLTELSDAIAALQTGKADASTITTIQESISKLGDTYATKTDMTTADAELLAKINAISIPSLEGYVKLSDLAAVATSGSYNDLNDKPEIPSIEGLATDQDLTNLQTTLQAAIDEKQAKGEYLVAADLKTLEDAVAALQSGKADASTVTTIQETISKLGDTYATDAELTSAIDAVELLIPTIPTKVSAFENDAGYITDAALTDYAKSADVEMVANKVSDATAEQIEAMSSTDKATKYPSIAVSQTIANAAVTKVNEVAGDLSTLQTQVSTNTADIAELDETVEDVRVVAYAAIPAPTEACKSASGACALSSDTEGNLTWVVIAGALNNN
ncbi:MAG: hypothetical protein IKA25_00910 [Alphaproteobacteria bacterium]|nr:hypothetical protein [Alphaproteobacteria bacterium]